MIKALNNEVVNSNRVVSNVIYGTVYNLVTSLLDAFDPQCMGLGESTISKTSPKRDQITTVLLLSRR